MKKSLLLVILLLLFVLVGCKSNTGNNSNESNMGNNNMNTTLSFKTMDDMMSYVPENDGAVVNLLGYFTAGDGDLGPNGSTRRGIQILGDGSVNIRAVEEIDNLIEVRGMMTDFLLNGVTIDCNKNAKTGVHMTAFIGCAIRNSNIVNFITNGRR